MPAKDIYHKTVRIALEKDGWIITKDPLILKLGARDLYVDLGAEKLLAAEKDNQKIAVEVKSFLSPSLMADLENALGQYTLYYDVLACLEPDRILYLAIREQIYDTLFEEPIGKVLLENNRFRLVVFNEYQEEILRWIP